MTRGAELCPITLPRRQHAHQNLEEHRRKLLYRTSQGRDADAARPDLRDARAHGAGPDRAPPARRMPGYVRGIRATCVFANTTSLGSSAAGAAPFLRRNPDVVDLRERLSRFDIVRAVTEGDIGIVAPAWCVRTENLETPALPARPAH